MNGQSPEQTTRDNVLAFLPHDVAAPLMSRASVRRYGRGQTIVCHGDESDSVFVALDGWIKVTRLAETGTEVLFGRCSEDLAVPYQPCIAALREWLIGRSAPTPEQAASVLGPGARALQRLVPELAESIGPEPAPGGHGDADGGQTEKD